MINRAERLRQELRELFCDLTGEDPDNLDHNSNFFELGFDSLLITQVSQSIQRQFSLNITFRQIMNDLASISELAEFIDQQLPPESESEVEPVMTVAEGSTASSKTQPQSQECLPLPPIENNEPPPSTSTTNVIGNGSLERVIQRQLDVMARQMDLVRSLTGAPATLNNGRVITTANEVAPEPNIPAKGGYHPKVKAVKSKSSNESRFGPFKTLERGESGGLTAKQQASLDKLTERYTCKTAKSKKYAQDHRQHFCDPRTAGNFRQMWKETVYPIVCDRSKGSRIWDIDGNEYIDVTMGFGTNYLGHSPDFVIKAVEKQMDRGFEIGPQTPLAGEAAELICELTGMDRATFCNTGSEAVLAAIRVARTVSGRSKFVFFSGGYHGIIDEVLNKPALVDDQPGAMPISPGVPQSSNVIVLEYGDPKALKTIAEYANEIAAVIVEPVQARHPDLQPREFLHDLRTVTEANEIALVFDEVITGFRMAPGGAQEWFGVQADMATYGKVIGGGMPIGALAGRSKYMDALDGGMWNYGDASYPEVGVTFFAGTFVRHPLAMAACHATLTYLKAKGRAVQEDANMKAQRLVTSINEFFAELQLPMKLQNFSTVFFYDFHPELTYASLLFYYLRDAGIHIWEGRVGHLSIAHTDKDVDDIIDAFKRCVREMQNDGFLPSVSGSDPSSQSKSSLMTEAQRELFLSAQMSSEANCAYNQAYSVGLKGSLDVSALEKAFLSLIERHPALRNTFSEDGEFQYYHPVPKKLDWEIIDLSDLGEEARSDKLDSLHKSETSTPLDLSNGPLLRIKLIKKRERDYTLLTTAHHMVCDGWSYGMIWLELSLLYNANVSGECANLPQSMPFGEYAAKIEAEKGSDESKRAAQYWCDLFKNGAPTLDLPTDRPRPPLKSFFAAMESRIIDSQLFVDLKKSTPKLGGSLFSTLLAVFVGMLHRLSGQDDIVVGFPAAGQTQVGCNELVGHCVNFLPMRLTFDPSQSYSEFSKLVKEKVFDAYDNQNFTFGSLVPKLKLHRDPSRLPIVSVMFNIDKAGLDLLKFDGLEFDPHTNAKQFTNMDIFLNLVQNEDSLEIECEYNTDLFNEVTIQRWLQAYEYLIKRVIEEPTIKLCELPFQSEDERKMVVDEWNTTEREYPDHTIHQLYQRQALKTPEKIAVECDGSQLSYAELDTASDNIARALIHHDIKPGDLVGLFSERSIEMVIGVLGILKSGAAYVPMDPAFPSERLGHMVEDAQMSVIITSQALESMLPDNRAKIITYEQVDSETKLDGLNFNSSEPSDLAYVIFTSGSTGRPKGVQIEHRALVNFISSMAREPGIKQDDVLLSVTTLSFDISGLELFLPLTSGARVVIANSDTVSNGNLLRDLLKSSNATIMQATPISWRLLLEANWQGNPNLKCLVGGEAAPMDLVQQLLPKCTSVWNMYGPTETTIWSTIYKFSLNDDIISIGRPIANTQIYVVSEELQLQPIGVVGELLIGGDGLARGYLNRSELTKQKFIHNPFSKEPGKKLYRTGDLARWHNDGTLECLGRIDNQVKLRGFRIELGEIESTINSHDLIEESIVSIIDDNENAKLVAFIKTSEKELNFVDNLRNYLKIRLPSYMIPIDYIFLESLPRTPNGKLDRKMILSLANHCESTIVAYNPPKGKVEESLAEIWTSVLGIKNISRETSFFDLGGNSLTALRLFNEIERAFDIRLPLAKLFESNTIKTLSEVIENTDNTLREKDAWKSLTLISGHGLERNLFLTHGAGGNVLLYRELANKMDDKYAVYGLQSRGLDNESIPHQTVTEMATAYLEEIRELQPHGPYAFAGYCLGGLVSYEMACQLIEEGESVSFLGLFDTYNPQEALPHSHFNYLMQRFSFHLLNLANIGLKNIPLYLKEKIRIATDGEFRKLTQKGTKTADTIQATNDKAADLYEPRAYSGSVTIFKPSRNYSFYPSCHLGWENLVLGGIDIVEVGATPHAMLVDPYVRILSSKLIYHLTRSANHREASVTLEASRDH